jgi:molybdate transport system substrate-binding protein
VREVAAALLLGGLALAGCGGGEGSAASGETVTVLAAASLTDPFGEIASAFEQARPGTDVVLSFGASSALAQQVVAGAPADVFATASPATMQTVVEAGSAREPVVFARNTLQIAVPPDNPGRITGLADLADPGRTIALCAEQVPCGAAADHAFAAAGLEPAPDTLEQDVKAVLSKVRLGEVDAGLVYRTDVLAARGAVTGIAFAEAEAAAAVNDYPIAALQDARDEEAAAAFVAFVLGDQGQRILADAGFDRG